MNVVFVINNMHIGGTRRSLLSLMESLPAQQVKLSLLIFSFNGELLSEIPQGVSVIPKDRLLNTAFCDKNELKGVFDFAFRSALSAARRLFGYEKIYIAFYRWRIRHILGDKEFDAAVGFQEGESNDFAAMLPAKKHIVWIHNDYDNLAPLSVGMKKSYMLADSIAFVAEASRISFLKAYPQYENKTCVIPNIVLSRDVIEKSNDSQSEFFNPQKQLKIVSVGRVSRQKGFDRALEVAQRLMLKGYSFSWVIIGGGSELEAYRAEVQARGLKDYVCFAGQMVNPYPVIKTADLFVMTSRYESQPLALIESLILGVPVITTNFPSAIELAEGEGGILLVENSTSAIIQGIESYISDKDLMVAMKKRALEYQYDIGGITGRVIDLCRQEVHI